MLYRPKEHRAWPVVGGQPVWTSKVWEKSNRWFLPGTHLMMEEDPEKAAKRITKEFFGLECSNPSQLKIQSHLRPSSRWKWMKAPKGTKHWDICFVYETRLKKLPKEKRPWHKDLKMVRLSEIGRKFKMGEHIDILRKAGYV